METVFQASFISKVVKIATLIPPFIMDTAFWI